MLTVSEFLRAAALDLREAGGDPGGEESTPLNRAAAMVAGARLRLDAEHGALSEGRLTGDELDALVWLLDVVDVEWANSGVPQAGSQRDVLRQAVARYRHGTGRHLGEEVRAALVGEAEPYKRLTGRVYGYLEDGDGWTPDPPTQAELIIDRARRLAEHREDLRPIIEATLRHLLGDDAVARPEPEDRPLPPVPLNEFGVGAHRGAVTVAAPVPIPLPPARAQAFGAWLMVMAEVVDATTGDDVTIARAADLLTAVRNS